MAPFTDVYSVMTNTRGANHGAISYGQYRRLISSVLPPCFVYTCCMHNVSEMTLSSVHQRGMPFGMDKEGQDYRACQNFRTSL